MIEFRRISIKHIGIMDRNDDLATYEVFDGTAWEVALLKSMLDDNEIESILREAILSSWEAFPVRSGTVKLFVARKDFDRARTIVEEFLSNMQKENPDDLENGA